MNREPSRSPVKAVRRAGQATIVEVVGDIDLHSSPEFQRALLTVLDENPQRVVINLSGVPYMDSSGVASLVKLLSRVRKGGVDLYLVSLSERVRSIFQITRLDSVFDIRATEAEALA